MASTKHLLVLGLAVLMVTESYGGFFSNHVYVYMTTLPESVDQPVSVHNQIGSEAKSTNYETRYNGEVCYNVTNFVAKSKGSIGNHRWTEVTLGEDCVAGRIITEHKLTKEEPFSVSNVYWYNEYTVDSKNPPKCTPVIYRYYSILTVSKYPDRNVKQMIQDYVKENNIEGLHRLDPSVCDV